MAGTFQKATELYKRGEYTEVIRLLEPQIFRFRESREFYYLLGMSCLRIHDLAASFTYLERSADLSEEPHEETLLGLAMVHLHRQENAEAIRYWLRILEINPKNPRALRGLELLRSESNQERINDLLEEGRLDRLLPRTRRRRFPPWAVLILLCAGVLGFFPFYSPYLQKLFLQKRNDFTAIELREFEPLTARGGSFLYLLTEQQITDSVRSLNKHFLKYRDNLAMREINRILFSNANQNLKRKVESLETNIRIPTFTDFKDNFNFREVSEDPHLYRDCSVVWRGRATNIEVGAEEIRFDFLVGYEEEKVLEGIIPVRLSFSADVTPNFPMALLARVVPLESQGFYLEGISLRRLWD